MLRIDCHYSLHAMRVFCQKDRLEAAGCLGHRRRRSDGKHGAVHFRKIHMDESVVDTLDLDIRLPDSFRYSFNDISKHTSDYRKYIYLPYCVAYSFAYNKVDNDSLAAVFAICPEKEYAIFDLNDSNDYFLIAAKEPLNDPQTILTYFNGFIEEYKFK